MITGSSAGIDIDAFGFGPSDQFAFVRLTDDPDEGGQSGIFLGADIDAVGAISTVAIAPPAPAQVPTMPHWMLMLMALLGLQLHPLP